jgi:hypothetical protein
MATSLECCAPSLTCEITRWPLSLLDAFPSASSPGNQHPFPRSTKRRSAGHLTPNLLVADRRSKRATPTHFCLAHWATGVAVSQILSFAYSYA